MISANLDRCFSFIQSQSTGGKNGPDPGVRRAITISRQTGCGAVQVAEAVANHLQKIQPHLGPGWTIFDRNLMERVMEDHRLPASLAHILPEDRSTELEDMLAETLHIRPHSSTIIKQTSETMLQLAGCGSVILIGRAGNIITARLPHVLHVRLVAPLEDRIERICRADNKTPAAAEKFCIAEDAARARYVKTYFKADINDPLLYHFVINTSWMGCEAAGRMIGDEVLRLRD
jgi:cytidylate kinase